MEAANKASQAQPGVVLGITFLLLGATFGLPMPLVTNQERAATSNFISPEVGNVYACVAWAGWAHFLYAFRGQGTALTRFTDTLRFRRLAFFVMSLILAIAALVCLRSLAGPALFGGVVWVYFIDHFLKSEASFEGKAPTEGRPFARYLTSYQTLLTFGWLSVILLDIGDIDAHLWVIWLVSLTLGAMVLVFGGWKSLVSGEVRGPLLSLFFVGEALVWGAFSRYGGPTFLTGVYIFHIAAGSYVHYLGSYFVANARSHGRDRWLLPVSILFINAALVALGYGAAHLSSLNWLTPLLGIEWFSLWVALHLVMSDLFPALKAVGQRKRATISHGG